jgi:5'-methylthioadenosine nucleosidase
MLLQSERCPIKVESEQSAEFDMTLSLQGSGFAWVAATLGVPFIGIKAITDLVDGGRPSQEEFMENLHTAAAALQRVVPEVVTFAAGKRLHEL